MKMKNIGFAFSIMLTLYAGSANASHKYKRKASNPYISNICYGFKGEPISATSLWHSALQSAINKYNSAFKNNGTNLGFCYNASYDSSPSGTDPNSIFRDPTGDYLLPQFTSKDKIAVRNLYWQLKKLREGFFPQYILIK